MFSRKKPIIGMIHLAGDNTQDIIDRARKEMEIYSNEGISGAIVENYHLRNTDIFKQMVEQLSVFNSTNFKVGINFLGNDIRGMELANRFSLPFVQQDAVAGRYEHFSDNYDEIQKLRMKFPNIVILGGVWPKYYDPVEGSNFEDDLREGMQRTDAIVITGKGTGKETPAEKLISTRKCIGKFPMIVGAGINLENAFYQMTIADGAIVGSCLKVKDRTENPVDKVRVRDLMQIIKEVEICT